MFGRYTICPVVSSVFAQKHILFDKNVYILSYSLHIFRGRRFCELTLTHRPTQWLMLHDEFQLRIFTLPTRECGGDDSCYMHPFLQSICSVNTKWKQNYNCITTSWLWLPARNHLLRLRLMWCDEIRSISHSMDIYLSFLHISSRPQVALKRQQAVEDAIAMRLASNETGKSIETLPPGKIYGMSVTKPCESPPSDVNAPPMQSPKISGGLWTIQIKLLNSTRNRPTHFVVAIVSDNSPTSIAPGRISESAIDMLAHLFPHRKRSVLELILRRCDLDLLKAIEQCRPTPSAFKPISIQV